MNKLEKILRDSENPRKYVRVNSFDDYLNLPLNKRYKWGFWYLLPDSLPTRMFNGGNKIGTWEDFNEYMQIWHPLQFFIRHTFPRLFRPIKWKLKDYKWKIYYIFKPQHRELTRAIGRDWRDLTDIIPDILFACVKSYVEGELNGKIPHHDLEETKGFERSNLRAWNKFYRKLEDCYFYIEVEKPRLEKLLSESYKKVATDDRNLSYKETYKESIKIEKELRFNDNKWLYWIVANRDMLWS